MTNILKKLEEAEDDANLAFLNSEVGNIRIKFLNHWNAETKMVGMFYTTKEIVTIRFTVIT